MAPCIAIVMGLLLFAIVWRCNRLRSLNIGSSSGWIGGGERSSP